MMRIVVLLSEVSQISVNFLSRCQHCNMRFNFIGKLETYADDMNLLLHLKNMTETVPIEKVMLELSHVVVK